MSGVFILSGTVCGGLAEMHYDLYQSVPICVDSSIGSDSNDGRGWGTPVKTLSRAVELVSDGGEIWVKESTVNTSGAVLSKSNVGIYGGFGGTESRREERDSNKRATVTSSVTTANNFSISANITNVTLDGLSFSGISNSSSTYNVINLGTNSGVSIQNCAFTGNTAAHQVYIDTGSILTVETCTFSGNTSTGSGAAIYSSGTFTISDSTFTSNYATISGGAIYSSGTLTISDSKFISNYATDNGGAIYSSGSTLSIADSSFSSNNSYMNAGAVYTAGVTSTNTFSRCLFESNNSTNYAGGAIFCNSGNTIIISNSSFTNNKAQNGGGGGALYLGNNGSAVSVSAYNSLFYNNIGRTLYPGNLVRYYTTASTGIFNAYNCTVINPSALSLFGNLSSSGTVNVYNTVIYTSSSLISDNAAYCIGYNSYTNISSGQTGCTVLSTLMNEFADFSGGNFRLASTSQLINAGSNSYVYGSYDLDSTARIKGGIIDIGCYEKK